MARFRFSPKPHADVLLRVFDLPRRGMTRALAESILALDFPEGDAARIEELNVRANEGELTDEEEAELEAYTNINDLLAPWQSKPRQTLQHAGMSGPSEAVRRRARNRLGSDPVRCRNSRIDTRGRFDGSPTWAQ